MAKVTYHKSHTFVDLKGKTNTFTTQLYQIGVYGILNNEPSTQGNFTPQDIKKMEKYLEKAKQKEQILSYELGISITVTDKSGFWEKVN